MSFVTLENDSLANGDDQLKDHITTLRETCNKCQVPHAAEMPIPQALTFREWGMPVTPFVEYFPLLWRPPNGYHGNLLGHRDHKLVEVAALTLDDLNDDGS